MKSNLITTIIVILIIIGGALGIALSQGEKGPSIYDGFAQCLGEQGATFYGAWWCPHCLEQKKMFGRSQDLLPYVECSTPDRQMTEQCLDAGIEAFPTWEFADGTREEGAVDLEILAERTSCELPAEHFGESSSEADESPVEPEEN